MQQPIDVQSFGRNRFDELFAEWQKAASGEGLSMGYDQWMDLRFAQHPPSAVTLRQGAVVFELVHRNSYAVRGDTYRIFRVQLSSGTLPFVSFHHPGMGVDFPWVVFPGVFTQAELLTLIRLP
ncbi:conserved protein of unknown function (plasmid) [Cupriavidus taiwanensis]|uniref:Uncharacterized protein n=1 Tax=Cupriavidus taiwanensis TaxID=164546 RepID=A0A375ISD8_9BURK|nr:conserved protein of unknown function [Cupriavidus taiwanensis]